VASSNGTAIAARHGKRPGKLRIVNRLEWAQHLGKEKGLFPSRP
jgi:hypothetical protein